MTGLISVKTLYAALLLNGAKSVEVRRSPVRLNEGDVLAVYATVPTGMVMGAVTVARVETLGVNEFLRNNRMTGAACITDYAARRYLEGARQATLICVRNPVQWDVEKQVSLRELRTVEPSFKPPQVWRRLSPAICARLGIPA